MNTIEQLAGVLFYKEAARGDQVLKSLRSLMTGVRHAVPGVSSGIPAERLSMAFDDLLQTSRGDAQTTMREFMKRIRSKPLDLRSTGQAIPDERGLSLITGKRHRPLMENTMKLEAGPRGTDLDKPVEPAFLNWMKDRLQFTPDSFMRKL
jgi:hypothetical protein